MKYSPDEHDGRLAAPDLTRRETWPNTESETPEVDAQFKATEAIAEITPAAIAFVKLARSLERRLSLAQTEIKGHMRVEDELKVELARSGAVATENIAALTQALVRIAELEKDAARLDYLEREMELEQKYLRDFSREDRSLALFRRNVPITRSAIDAALKSRA